MKLQARFVARLLIAVYDLVAILVVASLLSLGAPRPAYAYVDPSVMTYTIQALAGVAVALGAVAGVAFRRTRKALMKTFGIDEDARKFHEPPVHRVKDGTVLANAFDDADEAPAARGRHAKRSKNEALGVSGKKEVYAPRLLRRIVLSLFVVAFAVFTLLVAAPYEMVAGSEGSLIFGLEVVWQPIARFAAIVAAVLFLVLILLRGRAFNIALMLVFTVGLCFYVQAMFLNTGMAYANGETIDWNEYRTIACWTFAVWVAIIVIPTVASTRWKKQFQTIAALASAGLLVVQGVAVASLFAPDTLAQANEDIDSVANPASSYVMTQEGIYDISPNENVVVFVLDTYDTKFLEDAVSANPTMLDSFTGFTWFQDSVGSMIPTRYGLPFLLTGERPHYDESFSTFLAERYRRSPYLSQLEEAGYSMGIYSDTIGVEYLPDEEKKSLFYDKTINIHPISHPVVNEQGTVEGLVKCAIYRDIFWFAKPFFWFYTDEINRKMAVFESESDFAANPYVIDDAQWYSNLKKMGLSLADDEERSFRFIHLLGTHWPYSVDENGEDIGMGNATLMQQSVGTMKMVEYYINELKRLGVYDSTTIVITADHGDYYPIYSYQEKPTSPYVLVKPAQSAELDAQPLRISKAPVVAEDVLATVVDAIGQDGTQYGMPVFTIPEDMNRPRYYCMTINDENRYDKLVAEYEIDGDAMDMNNWKLTGHEWEVF